MRRSLAAAASTARLIASGTKHSHGWARGGGEDTESAVPIRASTTRTGTLNWLLRLRLESRSHQVHQPLNTPQHGTQCKIKTHQSPADAIAPPRCPRLTRLCAFAHLQRPVEAAAQPFSDAARRREWHPSTQRTVRHVWRMQLYFVPGECESKGGGTGRRMPAIVEGPLTTLNPGWG
jgi:hypothetical protein